MFSQHSGICETCGALIQDLDIDGIAIGGGKWTHKLKDDCIVHLKAEARCVTDHTALGKAAAAAATQGMTVRLVHNDKAYSLSCECGLWLLTCQGKQTKGDSWQEVLTTEGIIPETMCPVAELLRSCQDMLRESEPLPLALVTRH